LSLSLSKHHTTKPYGIAEVWLYIFLTSTLDEVERLASCSGSGKDPWFLFDRRLSGPQNWPGHWKKERYLASVRN
jgi:hypothetical protein